MNATYNITDDKLKVWFDSRLSAEEYAKAKACGFTWWPGRKCFASKWNTSAEDFILSFGIEIEADDAPDDVESRVERFAARAAEAEQNAQSAADYLNSDRANTERRKKNAINREEKELSKAEHWQNCIEGAIAHAAYKESPDVIARRVKGLESDLRKWEKAKNASEIKRAMWDDEFLSFEQALQLSNVNCGITVRFVKEKYPKSQYEGNSSLWSGLTDGVIDEKQAQEIALRLYAKSITRYTRWVDHLTMRLAYEKASLSASGYVAPVKQKSLKQVLPILNYRQSELIVANRWHKNETLTLKQVEMTAAEYAKFHPDYKGTDICEGSHRIRVAMCHPRNFPQFTGDYAVRAAVFITDSKTHPKP